MNETLRPKCKHCRRESCGTCECGAPVCHVHDGVALAKYPITSGAQFVPQCLGCRWRKS